MSERFSNIPEVFCLRGVVKLVVEVLPGLRDFVAASRVGEPREKVHVVKVDINCLADFWILHLDHHLTAAVEASAVHLPDGRRAERFWRELRENLLDAAPERLRYELPNLLDRPRRNRILEPLELGAERRRHEVLRHQRHHLPELCVAPAEADEQLAHHGRIVRVQALIQGFRALLAHAREPREPLHRFVVRNHGQSHLVELPRSLDAFGKVGEESRARREREAPERVHCDGDASARGARRRQHTRGEDRGAEPALERALEATRIVAGDGAEPGPVPRRQGGGEDGREEEQRCGQELGGEGL
mmetsp:Transcript_4061/g.14194  ORF Transcript_4061/g.14194 Transcript_4061/m.14194 type:complete len:302 (+) Transcript_4061:1512-2417(+)